MGRGLLSLCNGIRRNRV